MKKLVFLVLVLLLVSLCAIALCVNKDISVGSSVIYKDISKGLSIEPNDVPGPGPYCSDKDVEDEGEPISEKPAGFWLPPEDFLTEEEKIFRQRVIETAGLDENSPDFEEQLMKLYTATRSSEYPNYETYKLFVDHLATASGSK